MVESYVLARNTVLQKVGEEEIFFPFMVCALYGLLRKYKNHSQMICDLFLKTDIIFEEGRIEEILKRHEIELDVCDPIHDDEDDEMMTFGVSNQGHSFQMDEDGRVSFFSERPFVICSLDDRSTTHLLNTFCHEMGHLIKGEENGYSSEEEDDASIFVVRTGLAHYVYCYRNHFTELEFTCAFATLDEAINCIQTTDVMREILALPEFVDDPRIVEFVQSLNHEVLLKDRGYEYIVRLVRTLWKNEEFQKMIEDKIVEGDIDSIVEQFDSIMGEGAFEDMSLNLDQVYALSESDEDSEMDSYVQTFQKYVAEYSKKVKEKEKIK